MSNRQSFVILILSLFLSYLNKVSESCRCFWVLWQTYHFVSLGTMARRGWNRPSMKESWDFAAVNRSRTEASWHGKGALAVSFHSQYGAWKEETSESKRSNRKIKRSPRLWRSLCAEVFAWKALLFAGKVWCYITAFGTSKKNSSSPMDAWFWLFFLSWRMCNRVWMLLRFILIPTCVVTTL